MIVRLLWIGAGGALGASLRYLVSGWVAARAGPGLPWGTLLVNVLGSFGLAFLMHVGLSTETLSPQLRVAIGTGFFGALTTYSTFNYEATAYLQERAFGLAFGYAAIMGIACLAAGFVGLVTARALVGPG